MPLFKLFKVWVCDGQKTVASEHQPSEPWYRDGQPFVSVTRPTSLSSFFLAAGAYRGPVPAVSPRWFSRETPANGSVGKHSLESLVVVGAQDSAPSILMSDLENLIAQEFPGASLDKVAVEAVWSCDRSGPSLGLAPVAATGAVLRLTGPTDEPDGYREVSLPA